jgi:hypothetical protein
MYCFVNNLTPPHLWLHMFCYFLNNVTVKITILSIQSWWSVTEKRKWLDAPCPPFTLHYQLVIFLPLSIVVTCQYQAGFPTSTLSGLCGRWAQRMYAKRLPGTHAAPHNLHMHCPATVEYCDPGCNEDHMQPGVWGWSSSSCHWWSVRLAVQCKWIAG